MKRSANAHQAKKDTANIRRVAEYLGRTLPAVPTETLRSWAAIRIKQLAGPGTLAERLSNHGNCAVFIALEPWNSGNGFFRDGLEMAAGEDIVVENKPGLVFPGAGGATLVMLMLEI